MSTPPTRMTAYAASIPRFSGAHQKSNGSTRVLPSTMKARTSPMLDGLNTWDPWNRMRYFVSRESAATPANTYQPWVLQWSPGGVLGTRRISATPLPVSIALAGHTIARFDRNVNATSMIAQVTMAARISGTLMWKRSVV